LVAFGAGDASAVTARWQRHWRKKVHAPPLPYPELLHPQDIPPLASGFVMNVTKRGSEVGPDAHDDVARPRDVAERIAGCWRPPLAASGAAREITLRLQFARTGAVIGAPKITYVKAGAREREALVASIKAAVSDCAPLRFTPGMARAMAGYPFAIRFIAAGAD
jgi:hypothetical protein